MIHKISITLVNEYIISLLIILSTNSVYTIQVNKKIDFLDLALIILLVDDLLTAFFINNVRKFLTKYVLFSLFWIIYILLYALISKGNIQSLIKYYIVFFLLLLFFILAEDFNHRITKLFQAYSKIIFIIAIISLFFWLFGSVLHILKPNGNLLVYWGGNLNINSYYKIYYEYQNDLIISGRAIYRNIGVFAEAPMFSLQLVLALVFTYLFGNNKSKKIILFILGLTILTTASVTGILSILIIEILSEVKKGLFSHISLKTIIWILAIVICVIIGFRLIESKLGSASGSTRITDYYSGFMAWLDNPLFGSGYGSIYSVVNKYTTAIRFQRSNTGFTNSVMYVLVEGGIYFFTTYIVSIMGIIREAIINGDFNDIILATIIIFLFVTTVFSNTACAVMLLSIGFAKYFKDAE